MTAYYNDIDPLVCRVLRRRIAEGHLPWGDVDERDIRDVRPEDLAGYDAVHLFAGVGGFPLGFRWAGVPDGFPVCTGGFPCKQTSTAASVHGRRSGLAGADSGLWHHQLRILDALRPAWSVVENVAGVGPWTEEITRGLEGIGYRVSRVPLTARRLGAPHRRGRVFLVANLDGKGLPLAGAGRPPEATGVAGGAAHGNPWRATVAGVLRVDDAVPGRVDRRGRIIALGNSVSPVMARHVGRLLLEADRA